MADITAIKNIPTDQQDAEYGKKVAKQFAPQIGDILNNAKLHYGLDLQATPGIQALVGSRLALGHTPDTILQSLPQGAPSEFASATPLSEDVKNQLYGQKVAKQYATQIGDILGQAGQYYGLPINRTPGVEALIGSRLAAGNSPQDIIGELPQSAPTEIYGPQRTYEQIYQNVYDQTGLGQVKDNITNITGQINKINQAQQAEIQNINDNPWLNEGTRRARIEKINEKYEQKKGLLANQLTLQQGLFDRGREDVRFAAEKTFGQLGTNTKLREEAVQNAIKRAEAQAEANRKYQLSVVEEQRKNLTTQRELAQAAAGTEPINVGGVDILPKGAIDTGEAAKNAIALQNILSRTPQNINVSIPNVGSGVGTKSSSTGKSQSQANAEFALLRNEALKRKLGLTPNTFASLSEAEKKQISGFDQAKEVLDQIQKASNRLLTAPDNSLSKRLAQKTRVELLARTQNGDPEDVDAAQTIKGALGVIGPLLKGLQVNRFNLTEAQVLSRYLPQPGDTKTVANGKLLRLKADMAVSVNEYKKSLNLQPSLDDLAGQIFGGQ